MRIALFSDIHANLTALDAVLADAEANGVDGGAWVAGDIVGYGPDPNECLVSLQGKQAVAVAGNHDLAVIGRISTNDFNRYAREAAEWTGNVLTHESRAYLEGLDVKQVRPPFTIVHGSPRDPIWEYLLTVEEAVENLEHYETTGCMLGHSHLQFLIHIIDGNVETSPVPLNEPLTIGPDRFYVNPGSVGQPRDGDPRAAYAVLDWEDGTVEFKRVDYDVVATQQRMKDVGLPSPLIERLRWGR